MLTIIVASMLAVASAGALPNTAGPQKMASKALPPGTTYNIKDHAAKGDGSTDDTAAIQRAVDAAAADGAAVYVPAGRYLTGPIALPSNVTLYGDGTPVIGEMIRRGMLKPENLAN